MVVRRQLRRGEVVAFGRIPATAIAVTAHTGSGLALPHQTKLGSGLALPHWGGYVRAIARPLRIEFAGALYHITARGNAGADVFTDGTDRRAFLAVLGEVIERFAWRCHAYCLMGNHYHLVIETPEPTLSRGMRQLNGVYTQRFNRRHGRTGHLFQGRYHAVLVEREAHLLELARYVVLNPVRAGLAHGARDWRWSSYQATASAGATPEWLCTEWLLGRFGARPRVARRNYAAFVAAGAKADSPWRQLRGQIYLGGEAFVSAMHKRAAKGVGSLEVPRDQRAAPAKTLAAYAAEAPTPHQAMPRAYASGGYSLSAIAAHFGVHYSTVSRAARSRGR